VSQLPSSLGELRAETGTSLRRLMSGIKQLHAAGRYLTSVDLGRRLAEALRQFVFEVVTHFVTLQ